jgi:cytochrome P450
MLSFNTTSAIAAFHTDRNANVKKADWYKLEPAESGAYSVQTVIDKKEHAWRRRVLAPAFSTRALHDQEQFIVENADILVEQMTKEIGTDGWSKPKDLSVWTTYFGFDFISDVAFGSRFGLLEDSEHRYLPNMLMWASRFIYYVRFLHLT